MIGIWSSYASTYLLVVGIAVIVAMAPLAIGPLWWAKVLGWRIPADTDLAIYLGRSLGCVTCAVGAFAILVAGDAAHHQFFFSLLLVNWVLMVLVHVYGALKGIQPISETYEAGVWIALVIITLLCWPNAP